jgi:hypothetical protein
VPVHLHPWAVDPVPLAHGIGGAKDLPISPELAAAGGAAYDPAMDVDWNGELEPPGADRESERSARFTAAADAA